MERKEMAEKKEVRVSADVFTKEQLISSKKYGDRRDALSVLLSDGRSYSFEETDKILNAFLKRKVGP